MRKSRIIILVVGMLGAIFYFNQKTYKEKVYSIPGKKLFIRIKSSFWESYGYIYFGKDSASTFLPHDYLKLPKMVDYFIVNMYVNSSNDSIYFFPADNRTLEMKDSCFHLVENVYRDSNGINPLCKILGDKYMSINMYAFGEGDLVISQDSTIYGKRLKPIYVSE